MSTLLAITTFKKPQAADELIETLIKHNYHLNNRIILCDDSENREGKEVFEKYRKECKITYSAGTERQGIAVNKNRGLKYFFTKTHFDDILLLDDDLLFERPGLIEHCKFVCNEDIKLPFITGMWVDFDFKKEETIKGSNGLGWFSSFPVKAATPFTTWHEGSLGCMLYIQRSAAERVGYFNKLSYFYSHEHSLYYSRLLAAYGRCPELFPLLKNSGGWYYKGNKIPNNYDVDMQQVWEVNGKEHAELLQQVYQGYGVYNKEHSLRKSKEVLLES